MQASSPRVFDGVRRVLAYAWAAPYTACGVVLGIATLAAGGWWRTRGGTIEFGGGRAGRFFATLPPPVAFSAITLGHVVLGIDGGTLDRVRLHEHVHVRQYERWGPLFGPAYLVSSLWQLARGRRAYRDNHFERQAYAHEARSRAGGDRGA